MTSGVFGHLRLPSASLGSKNRRSSHRPRRKQYLQGGLRPTSPNAAKDDSQFFVFGNVDIEDGDDGEELSEIRQRTTCHRTEDRSEEEHTEASHVSGRSHMSDPFTQFLDHAVRDGDTLANLSLRYGCSVAALKRTNRLIQDQDFYALKSVLIPVKKYSVLTEDSTLVQEKVEHVNIVPDEQPVKTVNLSIGKFINNGAGAAAFLAAMDKDLAHVRQAAETYDSHQLGTNLSTPWVKPLGANSNKDACNGADCGIRWWSLLIVLFILGVLAPIIYAIYFSEVIQKHNQTSTS